MMVVAHIRGREVAQPERKPPTRKERIEQWARAWEAKARAKDRQKALQKYRASSLGQFSPGGNPTAGL